MVGTVKNTAAIQAEIAANVTANGVMTITPQLLSTVLQDIAVSYRIDPNALNAIVHFAADNTGLTDTSGQLQAAFAAAVNSGRPLYIPPGIYDCGSTSINITGAAEIYGAGRTLTTIRRSGSNFAQPLINITGSNVRVRDLTLKFTAPTTAVNFFEAAMIATNVLNIKYQNIEVVGGFYVGLTFYSVAQGWMDKCYVHGGVINRMLYIYGVSSNILVTNCILDGNFNQTGYGLNCNPAGLGLQSRITVLNSVAINTISYGFSTGESVYTATFIGCHAYGVLIGTGFLGEFGNNQSPYRMAIIGCTSIGNNIGVEFYKMFLGCVIGCRVSNNRAVGIMISDSTLCTIADNEVDNSSGPGIQDVASGAATSAQNIYMGNNSSSNTSYGMLTYPGTDRLLVYGNTFLGNTLANLSLAGTNGITASNITA
jgi:parallel beta-helix repeat protein